MMRIGLIVRGGVEEGTEADNPFPVFVDFIRRLARENEVQVVSLQGERRARLLARGGAAPRPYPFAGAMVHPIGTTRLPRLRVAADLVRVLATLRSAGPRSGPLQILHGIGQSPGLIATVAGRLLRVPSVVSLIGGELTSLPEAGYGELRTATGRALMALQLRWADALTAASAFMQKRVAARGGGARLLPFGIDVDRFRSPVARADGPPFRLLHVGNLYPVKDQLTLVRAVRLVVDGGVDVELDVVGWDSWDGAVQGEATRLALGRRVRFHGWQGQEALRALYRTAHIFVMSSVDDVAPVAVLEAAAAGLPVAGTEVGFIADWAPEMAIATPIQDPGALAAALRRLLVSRDERERLAARAQAWVCRHAALDANDAYVSLYRELIAAAAPDP
jgi:glycosyltransferase involved in cell wall biosynthesis